MSRVGWAHYRGHPVPLPRLALGGGVQAKPAGDCQLFPRRQHGPSGRLGGSDAAPVGAQLGPTGRGALYPAAAGPGRAGGGVPWFGALAQNETMDLPLTVEIVQEGEYSIGAAVDLGGRISGAHLNVIATADGVQISTDPIFGMKLRGAKTDAEKQKLLDASPSSEPPAPRKPLIPAEQNLDRYMFEQFKKKQRVGQVVTPEKEKGSGN